MLSILTFDREEVNMAWKIQIDWRLDVGTAKKRLILGRHGKWMMISKSYSARQDWGKLKKGRQWINSMD